MNLYAYVGNDPMNANDPNGTTCYAMKFGIGAVCAGPGALDSFKHSQRGNNTSRGNSPNSNQARRELVYELVSKGDPTGRVIESSETVTRDRYAPAPIKPNVVTSPTSLPALAVDLLSLGIAAKEVQGMKLRFIDTVEITTTKTEYKGLFIQHVNLYEGSSFIRTIESRCCIERTFFESTRSENVIRRGSEGTLVPELWHPSLN